MKSLISLLRGDRGVGMVTALSVSFVVTSLAVTWYAIGVHELDEVAFDANRTGAINMAEAGAREAMYLLANDQTFRDDALLADGANTGITAGVCQLTPVDSRVNGTPRQIGEYWYRATKVDPADPVDLRYLIESWGWAPAHDRRQSSAKKIEFEIELQPYGGGFYHALFASGGGLTAGNRKEIYGDAYSGQNVSINNISRIYANDGGYPGDGNLDIYGDLEIGGGSNVDIEGYVKVNGYIQDDKVGTVYRKDAIVLHDNLVSPYVNTWFRNATVNQTLFAAAPASDVTGTVAAGTEVYDATGIAPVPDVGLPSFTWDATEYSPAGTVWATWADFDAWYDANDNDLKGAHYVQDTGSYVLDLGGSYLTGHFVLAFDGNVTVKRTPSGSSQPGGGPAQIVLAGLQTTSDVVLAQSSDSIEGVVHHLIVTRGNFGAANQSTIYGAIYGYGDISSNRLEVHFRPPVEETVVGFEFDPSLADQFRPEPGVWRETAPSVDSVGLKKPTTGYWCNLP